MKPRRFVCRGAIMGKGNWLPQGIGSNIADYGGFYVEYDEDDPFFVDDLEANVVYGMQKLFPSFEKVHGWEHGGLIIAENKLAQVVLGDNEWSMAAYIVIPDTEYFPYPELGKRRLKDYLQGLREILLELYPDQVHYRTGPWTSGILRAAI